MAQVVYSANQIGPVELNGLHDPNSILDYGFDLSGNGTVIGWLQTGETLTSSQWLVSPASGVTLGTTGVYSPDFNGTATVVWVLVVDPAIIRFTLTNRITTNQNRGDDFSMNIKVGNK